MKRIFGLFIFFNYFYSLVAILLLGDNLRQFIINEITGWKLIVFVTAILVIICISVLVTNKLIDFIENKISMKKVNSTPIKYSTLAAQKYLEDTDKKFKKSLESSGEEFRI